MNLYTSSLTEIGSLRHVGPATAKRIIELRQKVFANEQPPLSPESLGALPGSRLDQRDWQTLLDDGTITLQIPEQIPDEGPEPDTEAAVKQMMRDEAKTVTVGQMENYGQTIIETMNNQMKTHLKEWSMLISNDIKDLKNRFDDHIGGLTNKLHNTITEARDTQSEFKHQLKETQETVNYLVARLPPAYSESGGPGNGQNDDFMLPSLRSLQTEDKMPFRLDFTGDRSNWLTKDEAIIRQLTEPHPSDGIYIKKDPDGAQTAGSQSSKQKDDGTQQPKNRTRERGRSKERTRTRRRRSPQAHKTRRDSSSRERTRARGGSSPPPFDSDSSSGDDSSDEGSDRSLSPLPPKMEVFSGDSKGPTWLSFITKFHRIARRRRWSKRKRLDRLFDCLAETALEFAVKSRGRHSYKELKKELGLRFDLREPPVAARQSLHVMKQSDDESLETYLQRVLTVAMNGYKTCDNNTIQQLATEQFLRGCKHKEAAALVINEAPQTVQEACRKVKTVLANHKAIFGNKVSFKENAFTAQEENRVSQIEKQLNSVTDYVFRRSSQSPFRNTGDRQGYSPPPFRDSWDPRQTNPRQRSPSYDRGWPPRDSGRNRFGDGEYRGRSPTRSFRNGPPQQGPYTRYRSPSPQRREPVPYYPFSQSYGGQYDQQSSYRPPNSGGQYTQSYRPPNSGGQYTPSDRPPNSGGQYITSRGQHTQSYRPPNSGGQYIQPGLPQSFPPNRSLGGQMDPSRDQFRQRSVSNETPDQNDQLSPEQTVIQDLNSKGLVVPATNY